MTAINALSVCLAAPMPELSSHAKVIVPPPTGIAEVPAADASESRETICFAG
jgi:hypothetical protein